MASPPMRIADRYEILSTLASGGTATVYLGRVVGAGGFSKPVAVKRLHPHLASLADSRALLIEEAKLVARIAHPNVVQVQDVVEESNEVFLVMEYVDGETLDRVFHEAGPAPVDVCVAIVRDVLHGLHAAHHLRGADGALLGLVHRDVTPRNIMVTGEGCAKILDFGIAKIQGHAGTTRDGCVRGTPSYMAPEQLHDEAVTARTDIHGIGIVLWEVLTGKRLFLTDTESAAKKQVLEHDVPPPSALRKDVSRELDGVVLRALARDPADRFSTALEMALALEQCVQPARASVVAEWIERSAPRTIAVRSQAGRALASVDRSVPPPPVEMNVHLQPRPARARWPVGIASGIAIVGATIAFAFASRVPRPISPAATLPAPIEDTASREAASAFVAPAVASAAASPAVHEAPAKVSRPPVSVQPSPVKPKASSSACPPYYVDSAGRRRFNRECLQ